MTKRTKNIVILISGIFVQLLSVIMYKVLNVNYLMCMNILIIYAVLFLIYNIRNRSNDLEINRNNVAYLYGTFIQYIALEGCIMENYYNGLRDIVYYFFVVIIFVRLFSCINCFRCFFQSFCKLLNAQHVD